MKERSPVGDHGGENLTVLIATRGVLLSLVPDGAADRERCYRDEHPFIKNGWHDWPVLVCERQRLRWPSVDAELCFPLVSKWDFRPVCQIEMELLRFREEPAVGFRLENANGDHIAAW